MNMRIGEAWCAEIEVFTVKTFVANAYNTLITAIAISCMHNARSIANRLRSLLW
jgi:hypothetical protein